MSTAQLNPLLRHIRKLAAGQKAAQRPDRQLLDDFRQPRRSRLCGPGRPPRPDVLRVCRRVLNHEQDAEDAFQATFLILARQTRTIRKRLGKLCIKVGP